MPKAKVKLVRTKMFLHHLEINETDLQLSLCHQRRDSSHFNVQKLSTRFNVHSLSAQSRFRLTKTLILEEYTFPIPDTCLYSTSVKTDIYVSSWA